MHAVERHNSNASVEMSSVQLNELVREAIAFTEDYARASQDERGARVRFQTELAENLSTVLANKSALRKVFINLLRNAIDAMAGEGCITVRTWAEDAQTVAEVSYTDERMSDEVQGELFRTPFITDGEREANQRLAACYAIVRHHGGDIEIRSALNEGTTFTIKLPVG
ncbi:MAG TPA: ATP-binding protein [Pyrinomonadaceae bacterium]|nr:ATP-binding protein [Pyrinomonadaceae bacterium]